MWCRSRKGQQHEAPLGRGQLDHDDRARVGRPLVDLAPQPAQAVVDGREQVRSALR
jgi:hypothetical protein